MDPQVGSSEGGDGADHNRATMNDVVIVLAIFVVVLAAAVALLIHKVCKLLKRLRPSLLDGGEDLPMQGFAGSRGPTDIANSLDDSQYQAMHGSRSEHTFFTKLDLAPVLTRSVSAGRDEGEYNQLSQLVRTRSYEGALDETEPPPLDAGGGGYEYAVVDVRGGPACPAVLSSAGVGDVVQPGDEACAEGQDSGGYAVPVLRRPPPKARGAFEPNAFVVDKGGKNLQLQSVRRHNPAYIQSVYLAAGDVVTEAGVDGTADS